MKKNTKIVCTLGPSSDERSKLEKMLQAGMNVARLNFSHGSYDHMKQIVKNIREASKNTGKEVAILQDLQGPKIRLGNLPEEGVPIKKGEMIILSTETTVFQKKDGFSIFPVQYRNLHRDVKQGDLLLLDDGYYEMTIQKKRGGKLYCKARNKGVLKSHKGINCPTASISAKTITSKDIQDLEFGLKQGIEYVALSFVKCAKDIENLRKILIEKGHPEVQIIAKIERHEAVKNLEAIAQVSDGLMVARGDMGLEIPAEQVPIVQKEIVRLGLMYAKPVIIATQILESMISNPRATRAEISDAATAIFDHADAFMLSAETSVGAYPIRAVRTLAKVARATENELEKHIYLMPNELYSHNVPITDASCFNAARLAEDIDAKAIAVITKTGYTARQVMKHRPRTPVIAVVYSQKVKRQLQLVWGIRDVVVTQNKVSFESTDPARLRKILPKSEHFEKGHEIVIVNAGKKNNFIRTVVL